MNGESIGTRLRNARESKKLSLEQVYAKTRIHIDTILALEEDRLQEYSPVYIRGFLKMYSRFLGLDTEVMLKDYEEFYQAEAPQLPKQKILAKKIKIDWSKFKIDPQLSKKILIGVAAVVVLIGAVSLLKNIRNRIASRPKVEEEVSKAEVIVKTQEKQKSKFARLAVRANDNCWLKVRLDGKTVYGGTLRKNMAESWQANEKIELSVGSAGAVDLEINGQVIPSLGRKGQMIKNIVITRDGFTIGGSR